MAREVPPSVGAPDPDEREREREREGERGQVRDRFEPGGALRGPLFATLMERMLRAPVQLEPGRVVGPYRVVEQLGRGGSATVYLAERKDGEFEQTVALKVIVPEDGSRGGGELLRRERQILAQLHHPHIAKLLDGGTTEDGLLWFAMEPVQGTRIDAHSREHALDVASRVRLLLQVCDAVQFAHARLLIHRDLKPSNILVGRDGEVKLLDFGIAIAVEPEGRRPLPALTPGFASPEQRRGDVITTASDIWQLGNLLEVLTRDYLHGSGQRDHDLRAVIAHATREDAAARYGSAGELARDLTRYLAHEPVFARRGGLLYRTERFITRHRWQSAIAALTVLALIAIVLQFTWRLTRERESVEREASRANAASEFVIELFRSNDPGVNRGRTIDATELLENGVERLRTGLTDQPLLRAQLLATVARIEVLRGEPSRAKLLFREALALMRGGEDVDPLALAELLRNYGTAVLDDGDPRAALPLFLESRDLLPATDSALMRQQRRLTLDVLSMAQLGSGDLDTALATQKEAVAIAEREHGASSVETAESLRNLCIVLRARSSAESAAAAERSLQIREAIQGPEHPATAAALQLYALILLDLGRPKEARPLVERSVELYRRLYHGKGANYASALKALGTLKVSDGDAAGALPDFQAAEALLRQSVEAESIAMTWLLVDLGDCEEALQHHESALAYFQRSLAIRRKLLAPDHFTIAQSLDGCSRQLVRLGRSAEAEMLSRESLSIRTRKLPASSSDLDRSMLPLGAARWTLGDLDGARELWSEALELIARRESKDSPRYKKAERYISSYAAPAQ